MLYLYVVSKVMDMFYGPELLALRVAFFSRLEEGQFKVKKGPRKSSQSHCSTFILEPQLKSPIYAVSRARQ